MGLNCKCSTSVDYATCAQAAIQQLTDDNTIAHYAAMAGATSSNWTMCVVKAFLYARRLIYYKSTPGDCGSAGFSGLGSPALYAAEGLGGAASVDPEPISKGILSGLASITGIFGAHHAQAVVTEQDTICKVSSYFNQTLSQLENAVKSGGMTPDQASQILAQVASQLDPQLAQIAKECNASCGFRIGLRALTSFMTDIGFPVLSPQDLPSALFSQSSIPSPGAPGTYGAPGSSQPLPGVPAPYQGASGFTGAQMNGNNSGLGPTSGLLTPGSIILIGGVAFVASQV